MNRSGEVKFYCLSSGSESNCFYLGSDDSGILIDAGLGVRRTIEILSNNNISINRIKAIFITHDHIDHVRAVASLGERRHIPVYATPDTISAINRRDCISPKLSSCVHFIKKEEEMQVEDFKITAFPLPHDAQDSVGYSISIKNHIFTFLTDLGHITSLAAKYIAKTKYLIIEANYDYQLLVNNPKYPSCLKERVLGDYGHLSNQQTAECILRSITEKTTHIWLCHLSLENNRPDLAYNTVYSSIKQRKLNIVLEVLRYGEFSCCAL